MTTHPAWYYDVDAYYDPAVMNRWMDAFPEQIREQAAPQRLVADSKRILSSTGGARELGLRDDLADLDLAALPKMRVYLDLLCHACFSMSLMCNYGARLSWVWGAIDNALVVATGKWYSGRTYTPWKGLERAWTAEAQAKAEANRRLAKVLLPIPQALVRWSDFDEARFRNTVLDAAADKSEHGRMVWNVFTKTESSWS